MSGNEDKIYNLHGDVSGLVVSMKSLTEKFDILLANQSNDARSCKRLRRGELIGVAVCVLTMISLLANPVTHYLANLVLKAVL